MISTDIDNNIYDNFNKLLIYGKNGWICSLYLDYLKSINYPQECIVLGNARLDDLDALEKEVKKVNPDNILSFTGRTHGVYNNIKYKSIDYLENPGKLYENMRDNYYSIYNLCVISSRLDIHYMY